MRLLTHEKYTITIAMFELVHDSVLLNLVTNKWYDIGYDN